MRTCGLTLGKYAPLHAGHHLVIETAVAEMDAVVVIVYDCPDITSVPLARRADWIRAIYPSVHVIEAWDGPTEVGNTPDVQQRHEDYILNQLKVRDITHFYSSEFYGTHMSQALNAVNRQVDPQRRRIPVSGTAIRANPFAYRAYLHPRVYRDMITNVVFLGAPSTGKTTLAAQMAAVYDTVWMPEYGREYWEQHQINRRLSLEDLVAIAEGHLQREEALVCQANRYLFTDTNALTTAVFSQYYHHAIAPRLVELANQASSRYDLVFVCDTDIPYDATWDRSGDANRQVMQKRMLSDLALRKIPFFTVRGDMETRIRYVTDILKRYRPYGNLLDLFGADEAKTPSMPITEDTPDE